MLTIDFLKETGTKPYYFGLGFIQCKIDEQNRYHFWHPELTPTVPEEQIHDHRYTFTSTIIRGSIIHETYTYIPNPKGSWEKLKVSCNPNDEVDYDNPENYPIRCDIKLTGSYNLIQGSTYTFIEREFHKSRANLAITHLKREPTMHHFAQVIKPISESLICPFEKKIPESELWEMIESIL
jgi:hypothetical protein